MSSPVLLVFSQSREGSIPGSGELRDQDEMLLLGHRFLRSTVVGLMFLLAGTACCRSDAYDPDPYDDMPPVVTVDFNYVVPSYVNVRPTSIHARNPQPAVAAVIRQQDFEVRVALLDDLAAPAFSQGLSHRYIPLRR